MSEIEEIKEKIDIVEFINELVPLKKSGRNFMSVCPFHSEKTPSFVVSPDRQIWHCFGACNEGGDIFKFLMKWENLDFPDALKELAKKAGVKLSRLNIEDKNWKLKEKIYEINHLACEYYHFLLTKHALGKKGLLYLQKRKINERVVETFMLGYAPNGWRNLFFYLKKKGYREDEMERAGVAIRSQEGSFYDRFRGRLIFALFDHRNNIVGLSGRTLEKSPKEAKYINSPETLVYHKGNNLFGFNITKEEVKKKNQIIICEGEFDVLSAFQHGIGNIAAVKGTALTSDQLRLIKRYCDEVVFAFDMDLAGDHAARRAIEMAEDFSLNVKMIKLPVGKDIDEAIQENPLELDKAFKKAISIYDFIIDSALARYPEKDPFSKKKIGNEIVPFLSKIQNLIVRNHFVKKIAQILAVSEDAINSEVEKVKIGQTGRFTQNEIFTQPNTKKQREEVLEDYLLSLVVQSRKPKESLKIVTQNIKIEDINTPSCRRIFVLLDNWQENSLTKFDKVLPNELLETYNKAYLRDIISIITDEKKTNGELKRVLFELKKIILKRKINFLSTKMKEAEEDQLPEINKEIKNLLKELQELEKKAIKKYEN